MSSGGTGYRVTRQRLGRSRRLLLTEPGPEKSIRGHTFSVMKSRITRLTQKSLSLEFIQT